MRGRKSGKIHSTPVDLLVLNRKKFLVAPRGRTEWVRNVEAAGEVTLNRGRTVLTFRLRAVEQAEKLPVLKAYLDSFRREVQRFFPLPAGSPAEAFEKIAGDYPAFELIA